MQIEQFNHSEKKYFGALFDFTWRNIKEFQIKLENFLTFFTCFAREMVQFLKGVEYSMQRVVSFLS